MLETLTSPQGAPANEAVSFELPVTLSRLQSASEAAERDTAWAAFVAAYTDVLLHACRSLIKDRDAVMDAYAFVLEALRHDGHRRLRAYEPDGQTAFSTWLLVVTRRLVLDHVRQRYGRSRSTNPLRRAELDARRRLEDLLAAEMEPDSLPAAPHESPDTAVRVTELSVALERAVAELTADDRLLLTLRYVDERSVREIARVLRLPTVFHVYRRLTAVLARLRELLGRRGIDEAEP
jgi:RNA polymerase sigma factor (sigma-70 family)